MLKAKGADPAALCRVDNKSGCDAEDLLLIVFRSVFLFVNNPFAAPDYGAKRVVINAEKPASAAAKAAQIGAGESQ